MKKIKVVLTKIEALFWFMCALFTVPLHSSIPYNIWLFFYDFAFVLLMILECFLPGEVGDGFNAILKKYALFSLRILGILGVIILAKYSYFFEGLYSMVFE